MYPDPILRITTKKVEKVDTDLLKSVDKLRKILRDCENGAGLAAPQIGLKLRFFGLKEMDSKEVRIYINPRIEKIWGPKSFAKIVGEDKKEEDFLEGCLSFPDYYGTVKRFLKIDAAWMEIEDGQLVSKTKTMFGFESIVFQHEMDHLDGILFVDHVKADNGKFYKVKGKKMVDWNVDEVIKGNL